MFAKNCCSGTGKSRNKKKKKKNKGKSDASTVSSASSTVSTSMDVPPPTTTTTAFVGVGAGTAAGEWSSPVHLEQHFVATPASHTSSVTAPATGDDDCGTGTCDSRPAPTH